MNVLQLVQAAAYEANAPAPSSLVSSTDAVALQYLNLFYSTGRELRGKRWWPQLKRFWTIQLVAGRRAYQLPPDFYSASPGTQWDQTNKWEMAGPMTDREANFRTYGYVTLENRKAYRIFGPDMNSASPGGQFYVDPPPSATSAGTLITFEYISGTYIMPANWAASAVYAASTYVNNFGNIYKVTAGGGGAAAAAPGPTVANGVGMDGGSTWLYIVTAAWGASTAYAIGDYVTNSGNYYLCTTPGTSASSGGPTTTASAITDNTVVWQYITAPAWAKETSYNNGTYIVASSKLYYNITRGRVATGGTNSAYSGKYAPSWTATTEVDGALTWTWQSGAWDVLVADTNTCLFDDDLMILGLKWRFMRARGFDYGDVKEEYELAVDTAVSRWMPGRIISLGSDGVQLAGLNPLLREGDF